MVLRKGGGLTYSKQSGRIGVDLPREFHVAPILRRVWSSGSRYHSRGNPHCRQDKTRPLLAAMAMARCAEGKKPSLKMALKRPTVGLPGEVWGVPHCFA